MGKSKTTTKSKSNETQSATPWAPVAPGLTALAPMIDRAVNTVQAQPMYGGDFIATGGDLQQQVIPAFQQSAALAGSLVDPALRAANITNWQMPTFAGPGTEAGTQSFGSGGYDPSGVHSVIQGAIQPYLRQLTEQVLPGLQSSGIESGAYTNDRALATLPGMAIRDTGRMAAEVASQIAFQDFLSQQERQLQAFGLNTQRGLGEADVLSTRLGMFPGLLDNAMRMSTGGAELTEHAAGYDTALRQAEINNAIARDTYGATAPFRGLGEAASLYSTFAPYATQNRVGSSTTTQTTQPSMASQIMQGALGIGGMMLGSPGGLSLLGLGGAAANPLIKTAATGGYVNPFARSGG